jgi:protein-arginine deiminase
MAWTGGVTLTLRISSGGTTLGTDSVRLQCAPLLLCDNTWALDDCVVVNIPGPDIDNTVALQNALRTACASVGATFSTAYGPSYNYDRWIQDSHETGAVLLPASGQPRRRADAVLQLARHREADEWCEDVLFGVDFGLIGVFSSSFGSLNYGGNLEIAPPYLITGGASYPWGRIVAGGGTSTLLGTSQQVTDRMDAAYREYMNALAWQGPVLEISSEWLAVGHIDEYLAFIPAPARPRGWVVGLASPSLARQLLQNVANAGGGSKTVYAGRTGSAAAGIPNYQTTVSSILGNTSLMSYNNAAQARLDSVRTVLVRELGLAANEIVDMPVLFEDAGGAYAVAYNPGVVNLVPINGSTGTIQLLVPDPEGPDQPSDVWQNDIRTKLQALGTTARPVQVTFVDVFYSYHALMGEAHCGVNFVRTPPAKDWWDK